MFTQADKQQLLWGFPEILWGESVIGGLVCGAFSFENAVIGTFSLEDAVAGTFSMVDSVTGTFELEEC